MVPIWKTPVADSHSLFKHRADLIQCGGFIDYNFYFFGNKLILNKPIWISPLPIINGREGTCQCCVICKKAQLMWNKYENKYPLTPKYEGLRHQSPATTERMKAEKKK